VATAFDGIDILVNNAARSSETIMEGRDDRWQYYWDLHVMAAVRFSRGLVPLMRKRGGGVITQHRLDLRQAAAGYEEPIYNTTKAALVMFSKCLANELVKDGIRVNAINPGLI